MTLNEALNYLGISHVDEANEALEEALFSLRQQIIAKGNLPQLLNVRKKKLLQLNQVASTLGIKLNSKYNPLSISKLESVSLIDSFNQYQKNKALILKQISSELNFENLENCIDNLMLNMKMYCSLWPEMNSEYDDQILLSNELESMEMLAILRNLKSRNICEFSDLTKYELSEPLVLEIKRLNSIMKSFDV